MNNDNIVSKVRDALIEASSVFSKGKINVYEDAIKRESNKQARWVMEMILENAKASKENNSPLCDDTGIPHILLDVGINSVLTGELLESINIGIKEGLKLLPGRPMAVKGNFKQRIEQSCGTYEDPAMLESAPILIRHTKEDVLRLNLLMFGGGPAIRGKTYRVFHKHNIETVIDEIVSWAKEGTTLLGCTPSTLAIGIGRSHYEASSLMLEALVDGRYDIQNSLETEITKRVNEEGVGALGLGGNTTVLGTFMKVGAQRASGVRIVCLRPCCCFEPRIASIEL